MTLTEIILIGIALGMDCFTVSLTSGTLVKRVVPRPMWYMVGLFGLFQGGMTWLGWSVSKLFSLYLESVDHWVAFVLLAYLGARMIYEGFKKEEEQKFNPLNYKVIFTLAVATSIDAMAVGVSLAFMGLNTWEAIVKPSVLIALISSLLTICGLALGIAAGRKIPFNLSPVGGLILISIGIKILIEHLS